MMNMMLLWGAFVVSFGVLLVLLSSYETKTNERPQAIRVVRDVDCTGPGMECVEKPLNKQRSE